VKFRRLTDKIRLLADELWERGEKELSTDVHEIARKAEAARKSKDEEYYRRYPGAVLTRKKKSE